MAFRIRRGTDTDRLSITPDEGELLYTRDTKNIFVGDGETVGGNLVSLSLIDDASPELSEDLDLGGNNIVGTGNINITGTITATGDINLGDGAEDNVIVGGQIKSSLIPTSDGIYDLGANQASWRAGWFEGINVDGEIRANSISVDTIINNDSSIIWESSTNEIQADLRGSVYSQDSGVIVNAETGDISATDIEADLISSDLIGSVFANDGDLLLSSATKELVLDQIVSNDLRVVGPDSGETFLDIIGNNDRGVLRLVNNSPEDDISVPDIAFGSVFFERDDINGPVTTGVILGTNDTLLFTVDSSGEFTNDEQFFKFTETGLFGIGTQDPQNTLDVRGEIVASGYMQFGTYTTTERDSLSVTNGAVIYNSTVDRFQGYQAGAWINLDDGTVA